MSIAALSKSTKTTTKRVESSASTVYRAAADKEQEKDPLHSKKVSAALKSIKVSSPDDPEEKEADDTADSVMRMPAVASVTWRTGSKSLYKSAQHSEQSKNEQEQKQEQERVSPKIQLNAKPQKEEEPLISRKAKPTDSVTTNTSKTAKIGGPLNDIHSDTHNNTQSDINRAMSSGQNMPLTLRQFMEPRFNADFSKIKIHSDATSAKLNRRLSAKAFAYRNHVFFAENQFAPNTTEGKRLIAHELTHSIQQGAATQLPNKQKNAANEDISATTPAKHNTPISRSSKSAKVSRINASLRNKTNASVISKVSREASLQTKRVGINHRTSPQIQRLGVQDALEYFADKAHFIPGFRMLTLLIGFNPIDMSEVPKTLSTLVRAVIELIPGGALITRALDAYDVFTRAGEWLSEQLDSLGITLSSIRRALNAFLDSLSWTDIFDLGAVWERAKSIFTTPINRIVAFVNKAATALINLIKGAILKPLAAWASSTRGWDLLCAVLGKNPITGEVVERTPTNLIGGFMKFIGQEEVWENIKQANAIARAWAWFQNALITVYALVRTLPQMIINTLKALQVADLLSIPALLLNVLGNFANFAFSFVNWAASTVMMLLKIIFDVVAPGLMPYLLKAKQAFGIIIKNPINFVRNLVGAGVLGFKLFAGRFLNHLKDGFINWLMGSLSGAGVYIPSVFSFKEIVKFVLSVLGITFENVRLKLVKAVGEPAVSAMEKGFAFVKTLISEGPSGLWRQLKASMQNLTNMVLEKITQFVLVKVVQSAVMKIVSMLNPAGAFVQAIIAIYNTVMFFVERMRTIIQVARSFLDSMMNIAFGKLKPAAKRVESTLAGLLTLAISFLARLVGLGGISKQIAKILGKIRQPIDKALDKAVNWVVDKAKKIGGFILQAGVPRDPQKRLDLGIKAALKLIHSLPQNGFGKAIIEKALGPIKLRYGLKELKPYIKDGVWWVEAIVNPKKAKATERKQDGSINLASKNVGNTIDILDSANNIKIKQFSRSDYSGEFDGNMTGGAATTLSKVKVKVGDKTEVQDVEPSPQIAYSIADVNSAYPPPKFFKVINRSNPEAYASYQGHRKKFSGFKYRWWRDDSLPANHQVLIDKGWLLVGEDGNLKSGDRKWQWIHDNCFNDVERLKYKGNRTEKKVNRSNMRNIYKRFASDGSVFNELEHQNKWLERIGQQTEIHHLLPLDFGASNDQAFIPLSRDMHTKGAQSVHLKFWNPMKHWLLKLKPKIKKT